MDRYQKGGGKVRRGVPAYADGIVDDPSDFDRLTIIDGKIAVRPLGAASCPPEKPKPAPKPTPKQEASASGHSSEPKKIIDLDGRPFCPHGWKVLKHDGGGLFTFDPDRLGVYLTRGQTYGKRGYDILTELEADGIHAANAVLMEFLYENWHLTPKSWRNVKLYFWGTIFEDESGCKRVRYLELPEARWKCKLGNRKLTENFGVDDLAATIVTNK